MDVICRFSSLCFSLRFIFYSTRRVALSAGVTTGGKTASTQAAKIPPKIGFIPWKEAVRLPHVCHRLGSIFLWTHNEWGPKNGTVRCGLISPFIQTNMSDEDENSQTDGKIQCGIPCWPSGSLRSVIRSAGNNGGGSRRWSFCCHGWHLPSSLRVYLPWQQMLRFTHCRLAVEKLSYRKGFRKTTSMAFQQFSTSHRLRQSSRQPFEVLKLLSQDCCQAKYLQI